MSRCDIEIQFDQPDRTYRGGDTVRGEAVIKVNEDTTCKGIELLYYWKTHGRGNTDSGEQLKIQLAESQPLSAGDELRIPFEFEAARWPLTYHGDYIYVDHYVRVAVDVPWAFDPKTEEEFILLPGKRPEGMTGDRTDLAEIAVTKSSEMGPVVKVIVFGLLGLVLLMLAAAFFFLIPIILVVGGGYWIWRQVIASRVGKVDYRLAHVVVGPGEKLPARLAFTPRKTFPVNGITLTVTAQEEATSGSGTNKTTHRNTIYEEIHMVRPAGSLSAGEAVEERYEIPLPESRAWSIDLGDNVVSWKVEARIDIPRFPDWSKNQVIQFLPTEFLSEVSDDDEIARIDQGGSQESEFRSDDADAMDTLSEGAPYPDDEVSYEAEDYADAESDTEEAVGYGEDMGPLLALIDELQSAGRFSNERSRIAEAAAGHTFDVAVTIDRVSTTFSFSGDDERYRNGRTIVGKLEGTEHEVQLFTVVESNAAVDRLKRGDVYRTLCTVATWDSLYDRLILHEVPYDD